MKTPEQRADSLEKLAFDMHAEMPTDVYMRGDGTIWIKHHDRNGGQNFKISNEEAVKLLFKAMDFGNRMISV